MNVPENILKKGYTTFYYDTDPELVKAVHEYNDHMKECRARLRNIQELRHLYLIINPLEIGIMICFSAFSLFRHPLWAAIILPLNAIIFLAFFVWKDDMKTATVSSLLLLLLDWRFLFFLITPNIILTVLYEKQMKPLKVQPGYPVFADINYTFEKMKTPVGY